MNVNDKNNIFEISLLNGHIRKRYDVYDVDFYNHNFNIPTNGKGFDTPFIINNKSEDMYFDTKITKNFSKIKL